MGTVPQALRDLVVRWRASGSPPQPGMEWPRQAWIGAFPEHRDALRVLPELLDREAVSRACIGAAVDARAAARAFVAVMAWGHGSVGYGRWRTLSILTDTPGAGARLAEVARTLSEVGAVAACRRLASRPDCRLRGLGPAFGTKYLYFIQPQSRGPRALILDSLVAGWLGRETVLVLRAGEWSIAAYARYLESMYHWATSLGCEPDELECCIFRAMAAERGNQWGRAQSPPAETTPARPHKGESVTAHAITGPRVPEDKLSPRSRRRILPGGKGATEMPREFRAGKFRPDVYAQLVAAAKEGHTVAYGDLPGGRGHIGGYLYRIADFERARGRPPLTALVVHKHDGLPGEGFAIAAAEVGYTKPGESDSDVWERACAEVFAYWRQ